MDRSSWIFIQTNTVIRKEVCTPMLTAALFTTDKIWVLPKCPPIDEGIKKMRYIHTVIKEWNPAIYNDMDGPRGYYVKWNESEWKTNTEWLHLYL